MENRNLNEENEVIADADQKKSDKMIWDLIANAHELEKMSMAHEIAMNDDFKLPETPEEKSSENMTQEEKFTEQVKEIMQSAFWDCLREDLSSEKPSYKQAFVLLDEIKTSLHSFLPPNRKTTIYAKLESLDTDFLRQQAENDALNVSEVALFIVDIMSQLCAPARDAEVAALRDISDIVAMFQKIYKVLDVMKIDMANFAIRSIRPHVQKHHIEYERSKFSLFVQKSPDGLSNTRKWLLESFNEVSKQQESMDSQSNSATEKSTEVAISPMTVLSSAYTNLLKPPASIDFPETLYMDKERYAALKNALQQILLVASAMIQTTAILGQPLSSHKALFDTLKTQLITVTTLGNSQESLKVGDALDSIFLQTWEVLTSYVSDKDDLIKSCVSLAKKEVLKAQISSLVDLHDNHIYQLLFKRLVGYMQEVVFVLDQTANSTTQPVLPSPPSCLNHVASEANQIAMQYAKLVNLNKAVYGPFYVPILRDILNIPPAPQPETGSTSTAE